MAGRNLGEKHPDTIVVMGNLACLLRNQGELDEAVSMQREVLEKRRRILGENILTPLRRWVTLQIRLGAG
jgi:hypothetical protein